MKKMLLILSIASTSFVGCNSIYKSQQTPDDLYYSPGQEISASEQRKNDRDAEQYQQYVSTMDDNYLRMRVSNYSRWSSLDNFSYWNDMRYGFSPIGVNTFTHGWGWNIQGGITHCPRIIPSPTMGKCIYPNRRESITHIIPIREII